MQIRAVSYNVQSFRAGLDRAANVLAPEQPDIVFLQECGSKRAVRALAHSLEMDAESSHRSFGRVHNAVLFRPPWSVFNVEVGAFTREGQMLARGFVAVRLRRMGMPLTVIAAHLGLAAHERETHARELTDWLAGVEEPVVLGLDLNEGPESPAATWLASRLFDVFGHTGRGPGETFPARVPTTRIDYLYVTEQIRPLRAWVSAVPDVVTASDHRPVIADLELEGTKVKP